MPRVVLDAVLQAQGKGCGPGILGVCIGGDRATGYELSKTQFLRRLDDRNQLWTGNALEQGHHEDGETNWDGPMGFGARRRCWE